MPLLGWLLDLRWMIGFGFPLRTWPWTAVGLLGLSGAFLGLLWRARAPAYVLLAVPVSIAGASILQSAAGLDLGLDRLLFPARLGSGIVRDPGLPPDHVAAIWLILAVALVLAGRRGARGCRAACLLASVPLALATISAGLLVIGAEMAPDAIYFLGTAMPTALAILLTALGICFWCQGLGWPDSATAAPAPLRAFGLVLPLILLLPGLIALFELSLEHFGVGSRFVVEAASGVLTVLLVAGLLFAVLARLAAQVSARVAMEAALGRSRERLADALEAYGLGIVEWDASTGITTWHPGSEARLGLEPGVIRDFDSWRAATDPEDFARIMEDVEAAAAEKADRFRFRFRYLPAQGRARILEGINRLYYDDEGVLTHSVGIAFDVTEREAWAARLEAQSAQLQSMLDTVPDAMIVIDEEGGIVHFGAGAERTLGYDSAEMIGRNFAGLAPERLRGSFAESLAAYRETGRSRLIGRVTRTCALRADGVEIPVELMVGAAMAGETRLFTLLMRDISERLESEEHLSSLSAELAHSSRLSAMGEMAAGIAHELNQPLTAISNYLAAAGVLIRSGRADPEKLRELLEVAGSQAIRAGQIIRRMRNFAAKGRVDVKAEPVGETIREAVSLVFVGPMPNQISIRYDLHPEARTMLVDRIQLQQVLVNLLRNAAQAIQACPAGTREIILSAHWTGSGMIEIGVSDSGPGLDEPVLGRLFEPFTSGGGKEGMGVGLSICRRIVEAHGGRIWAENRSEGGAIFRFTVPGLSDRETEAA